jgi:uncharacterized protein (TIGR02271 family)
MADEIIIAIYDELAHADAAVRDLKAANVPSHAIHQHTKGADATGSDTSIAAPDKGFWDSLFGSETDEASVYQRSMASGSTVVTVTVPAEHFDSVSAILERHQPIDMEERTASYGLAAAPVSKAATPSMGATAVAATDDTKIQLAEESLAVGKRAVSGGTTRIRRYVVETPVEEQVALRTEKVTIERRPVTDGRVVADADFTDKTIEMTETSEEAVISKTARVVEEVAIRKDMNERIETVKDTVRRDEVEIEKVPGTATATRTTGNVSAPSVASPKI